MRWPYCSTTLGKGTAASVKPTKLSDSSAVRGRGGARHGENLNGAERRARSQGGQGDRLTDCAKASSGEFRRRSRLNIVNN
jgi:hypothetical protein